MHRPDKTVIAAVLCGFLSIGCADRSEDAAVTTAEEDSRITLPKTAAPEGARVFFVTPADGDSLTSPVHIEFGAEGVSVVPAGDPTENSGHHHLLINTPLPDLSQPIPKDDQHRHFGGGQTAADIELAPGRYELTMLLGDYLHIPHEPPIVSPTITITVTE